MVETIYSKYISLYSSFGGVLSGIDRIDEISYEAAIMNPTIDTLPPLLHRGECEAAPTLQIVECEAAMTIGYASRRRVVKAAFRPYLAPYLFITGV